MTQTAKTILGGIGILVIVLALVAVANKNLYTNLDNLGEAGGTASTTPITSIDKQPTENEVATTTSSSTPTMPNTATRQATSCRNAGGTWDGEHNECTGISQGSCHNAGGTWDACASPCRNNPSATTCIQSCVEVCTIK